MTPGSPDRLATALADRYRLERELGAGGMATVYLATDLKHDREVALKVLKPELAAVLGADRFLAEVKITARLDHPHILTLIDSGEAFGQLFYVLPYVRGQSLRARLEQEKQLGIEETLRICAEVASALDYAHRQGVVHRDIKPENVLFHEGEAMLADFGIALAVKQAGGNRLTETGLSLGTPQYMSPEQATGDRQLDARSDVYSLAAVVYEMLAGEPPVTGPTVQAVIAKLLTERPTRLRVVRDTVPEGVDVAVAKALAKVPSDRFATAGEFSAALERAVASRREVVRPQGAPRWVIPVGIGALLLAAVVLALRGRGAIVRPAVAPIRTQVTFSGNAESPSISPDGSRIAYVTRQCDAARRCTYEVKVQDVRGAGSLPVMSGLTAAWRSKWSTDGRYLLVKGSHAPEWGSYLVPATVQGPARYLGCCDAEFLAGPDSVVFSRQAVPGDSSLWVRVLTTADGQTHDSIRVRASQFFGGLKPSPDGRWMAYGGASGAPLDQIMITTRSGRVTDSVLVPRRRSMLWAPDGTSLLVAEGQQRGGLSDIVRRKFDPASGRLSRSPETVVSGIDLGLAGTFDLTGDGSTLSFATGPTVTSMVALARSDPTSTRFTARTLKTSTARVGGTVSPSGNKVIFLSQVSAGDTPRFHLTMMPFDSGPESEVTPPIERILNWVWADAEDRRIVYSLKDGPLARFMEYDAASGRSRPMFVQPDTSSGQAFSMLADGRLVISHAKTRELQVVASDGRLLKTIRGPDALYAPDVLRSSPSRNEIVMIEWDVSQDSILVYRWNPEDGRSIRAGAFIGEGWQGLTPLLDGSVQVAIAETDGTSAQYSIPPDNGPPRRLGVLPYGTAYYMLSATGRRALVTVTEYHADVWLIRNFGELLKH